MQYFLIIYRNWYFYPIFRSLLFDLEGFRLPFYVTGTGLYTIMICAFFIFPFNEEKILYSIIHQNLE